MKRLTAIFTMGSILMGHAQHRDTLPVIKDTVTVKSPAKPSKPGPKPYKDVITDKAVSKAGLFTVHKVDDHYYFELPNTIIKKQIMSVTRYSKVAGGAGIYAGELANEQVVEWEPGPNFTVFLKLVTTISVADTADQIYKAVSNSYFDPIVASFDIKAFGKDYSSVVIDVTDFFKGDNQVVSLTPAAKLRLRLGTLAQDRSYIDHMHSFSTNTEVCTVKTFNSSGIGQNFSQPPLPAVEDAGVVTMELNTSFIELPDTPMQKRLYDPRVGYFADDYMKYGDAQQKVEDKTFILRWRLEPKDEDSARWIRGELVEPKKPLVYYIDPATPKQWRPYLIAGINDWQKAFEQAGFKNAIIGKEWPENDSAMSLEDARYSVIRYFASDMENAYGPNVNDPRSGEILESHVGWYHNVMQLLHDWCQVQTGAVDSNARKPKLDDSLMGLLIRFVVSHEIGHTLGLRHNFGSSSTVPVEKLRDKTWLDIHGHTPSIMDYARFNYVAQPEDNIPEYDLFPRIGEYDRWAIQWGYAPSGAADEKTDHKITNQWAIDSLKANPRLWFGVETNPFDPRSQSEDLGDNAMLASAYGIKNLQRILPQLAGWNREDGDKYDNLREMYQQVAGQFSRYMGHVLKNIGGIYETPKSIEELGSVYAPVSRATQKEALAFLQKQLFTTPEWLLDTTVLNNITNPASGESIENIQTGILNSLLSAGRLNRMLVAADRFGASQTYAAEAMLEDVQKGIFSELSTGKITDRYRRNLQKNYVESLIGLLNPPVLQAAQGLPVQLAGLPTVNVKNTDIPSIVRAQLEGLQLLIQAAIPNIADKLTKYHLEDISNRIKRALNPK